MPALNSVVFNILCRDLVASAAFYKALVGFDEVFTTDWYVILSPPDQPGVQLGLIDQVSEFAPRHAWGQHEGTYITLFVRDVFAIVERARALGAEVIEEPVGLATGQARALIRDPNGLIIDLSTPIEDIAAREDVVVVQSDATTAIDLPQAEQRRPGA